MILIIILIYVVALTFLIFILYDYLTKDKRKVSTKFYSFVQTIAIILTLALASHAILLSIQSLNSSDESNKNTIDALKEITHSTKNVKYVLDTVSAKLALLPSQIDSFSSSIHNLNSSLANQQEKLLNNINILEKSVNEFENSLKKYSLLTTNYSETLNKVTQLTNQQLEIWEKQQEITKKELSRRPILSIEPLRHIVNDSLLIIKGIVVLNLGNIESDIKSILFFVPKINFVKIAPSNAVLITEDKELYSYEFSTMVNNFNPLIITDKSKMQIKEIEFY